VYMPVAALSGSTPSPPNLPRPCQIMEPDQDPYLPSTLDSPSSSPVDPSWDSDSEWRPLLPPGRAHLIPVEILSEIFLLALKDNDQHDSADPVNLMLVCRHWRAVMLLTPGICCDLKIRESTQKEEVQEVIRRKWLVDVSIEIHPETVGEGFNTDDFLACLMAAAEVASRWRSLWIRSFPLPIGHKAVKIVQPLERLESFTISTQGHSLGNFFESLMTAIPTTPTSYLTKMYLHDSNAVLYLAQPARSHIFHSLKTLTISLSTRMEAPADILPHLQRLDDFSAHRLHLPNYPPDASLPLIQTLQTLRLKSVSVQWMAGRVFPALRRCAIGFPHHIDTVTLQPVTMLSCTDLEYESNDLRPLACFRHPPLASLGVKCGQWSVRRGNPQLVAVCPIFTAQSLTYLDLRVRCSEWLLVEILSLVPALTMLFLQLASPHALSEAFFLAFVATESNAGSPCEIVGPPGQTRPRLCPSLRTLYLSFKRWLRGPEKSVLIPVLGDIVASYHPEDSLELGLTFGVIPEWYVGGPVGSFHELLEDGEDFIGISSLHGIIPMLLAAPFPFNDIPFKEAEYLLTRRRLSIDCLLTLNQLVELRTGETQGILPTTAPHDLPLFRTLRVLDAHNTDPLFLANQTFHKLERCRVYCYEEDLNLSQGQLIEMPICTRLDINHLTLLATIKLPLICELGVSLDHPDSNMIWGKHIAMNANLPGLRLLHVHDWHQETDLIEILRSLPALQTLILGNCSDLDVNFFSALDPMGAKATYVMKPFTGERWISIALCPTLEHLFIEGMDPTEQPELIAVLNEVVTLRSMLGSPLKEFNFAQFQSKPRSKLILIGRDGSFAMEKVILARDAMPFELYI